MSRSASDVEPTTPACFARFAIAIPAPAVSIVTSGIASGIAPALKRASKVASARARQMPQSSSFVIWSMLTDGSFIEAMNDASRFIGKGLFRGPWRSCSSGTDIAATAGARGSCSTSPK